MTHREGIDKSSNHQRPEIGHGALDDHPNERNDAEDDERLLPPVPTVEEARDGAPQNPADERSPGGS